MIHKYTKKSYLENKRLKSIIKKELLANKINKRKLTKELLKE